MLVFDDEILKDPHMTLVNEPIHGYKHVGVYRIAHLLDFVAFIIATILAETFSLFKTHLSQILHCSGLLFLKKPHVAFELWLSLITKIDGRLLDLYHLGDLIGCLIQNFLHLFSHSF